jgi:hypothetical protein
LHTSSQLRPRLSNKQALYALVQTRELALRFPESRDLLEELGFPVTSVDYNLHHLNITSGIKSGHPWHIALSSSTGIRKEEPKKYRFWTLSAMEYLRCFAQRGNSLNDGFAEELSPKGFLSAQIKKVLLELTEPESAHATHLTHLIGSLMNLFHQKEGIMFYAFIMEEENHARILDSVLLFDDAAYLSAGRHPELHSIKNKSKKSDGQERAENDGIVYIRLVVARRKQSIPQG